MKIDKLISTLLIATFIVPNLYAEPCINCVAVAFKKDTQNLSQPSFISNIAYDTGYIIPLEENTDTFQDEYDDIIPLEENIDTFQDEYDDIIPVEEHIIQEEQIVLIDNSQEGINSMEILYACDDSEAPVLMCDSITQECECV